LEQEQEQEMHVLRLPTVHGALHHLVTQLQHDAYLVAQLITQTVR
jgi:hypothetical protein